MPPTPSRIMDLALQWGRTSVAGLDLPAALRELCGALPEALGVSGAVIMLSEPPDPAPTSVHSSDAMAEWMGEVQRRAGRGPLPDAMASGRSMLTPDLTRIGPPELAAAAAECGLTSSSALSIRCGVARLGALQLLGTTGCPVTGEHGDAVRLVVEMVAARLADVHTLRLASGAGRAQPRPVPRPPQPPAVAESVPAPRRPRQPLADVETSQPGSATPAPVSAYRIVVEPGDEATMALVAVVPRPAPVPEPVSRHAAPAGRGAPRAPDGGAPRAAERAPADDRSNAVVVPQPRRR